MNGLLTLIDWLCLSNRKTDLRGVAEDKLPFVFWRQKCNWIIQWFGKELG